MGVVSGVFRISKRGAKFSLATSAYTKEGANQVFQFFFIVKKNFCPKGGPWPLLNTPLGVVMVLR